MNLPRTLDTGTVPAGTTVATLASTAIIIHACKLLTTSGKIVAP